MTPTLDEIAYDVSLMRPKACTLLLLAEPEAFLAEVRRRWPGLGFEAMRGDLVPLLRARARC